MRGLVLAQIERDISTRLILILVKEASLLHHPKGHILHLVHRQRKVRRRMVQTPHPVGRATS